MAERKVFIVDSCGVIEETIDFKYYTGFAISQKQKSIDSLHKEIKRKYHSNILEVSSKSKDELGVKLSAFNLKVEINGKLIAIENIFQSSKVFEKGGPYTDLLFESPIKAKKDIRLKDSGKLIKFIFKGKEFPIKPKTLFYDWIYCITLTKNKQLINDLVKFDIFTDIEFNDKKSINCQARSAALFVYLYRNNLIDKALENIDNFKAVAYSNKNDVENNDKESYHQISMFD